MYILYYIIQLRSSKKGGICKTRCNNLSWKFTEILIPYFPALKGERFYTIPVKPEENNRVIYINSKSLMGEKNMETLQHKLPYENFIVFPLIYDRGDDDIDKKNNTADNSTLRAGFS